MRLSDFELFCERHQSGMSILHVMSWATRKRLKTAVQEALSCIYRTFGKLSFRTAREERVYALRAAKNAAIDLLRQNKPCETLDDISMDRLSLERGDTTYSAAAAHSTEEYVGRFIQAASRKDKRPFSAIDPSVCPTRKSPRHCLSLRIMSGRLPFGPRKS